MSVVVLCCVLLVVVGSCNVLFFRVFVVVSWLLCLSVACSLFVVGCSFMSLFVVRCWLFFVC